MKVPFELPMVVHLAVVREHPPTVAGDHRLPGRIAEIQDRQAPSRQRATSVLVPQSCIIWSAPNHHLGQSADYSPEIQIVLSARECSGDSTHGFSPHSRTEL